MKKVLFVLLAVISFNAQADSGWALAGDIIGGVVTGGFIGKAIVSSSNPYGDYNYVKPPVYSPPPDEQTPDYYQQNKPYYPEMNQQNYNQ
jgi:hypothetical protein